MNKSSLTGTVVGANTLIVTGFTGDICVLFTAIDAHLHDYHLLIIPDDWVVSQDAAENELILKYMKRVLEADTRRSSEIDLPLARERPALLTEKLPHVNHLSCDSWSAEKVTDPFPRA